MKPGVIVGVLAALLLAPSVARSQDEPDEPAVPLLYGAALSATWRF